MNIDKPRLPVKIMPTRPLYKWSKIFNRLQRNFFVEPTKLRREKQIEDFIRLNGYQQPWIIKDTDILHSVNQAESIDQADIIVITDQKFSRYPCPELIRQIQMKLHQCPEMYLCLNRHYINIDNSFHDMTLDENFNRAITEWLSKNLPGVQVIDLGLDFVDYGRSFSWAVADRHYYLKHG